MLYAENLSREIEMSFLGKLFGGGKSPKPIPQTPQISDAYESGISRLRSQRQSEYGSDDTILTGSLGTVKPQTKKRSTTLLGG